jgi:hypothetical protein
VDQISGTTPADAQAQVQDDSRSAQAGDPAIPPDTGEQHSGATGFGARGRMRRRARFLRKARELAYRDLGGLVFNLHRFGQRNDALVMGKLTTLGHIDAELRTLEAALRQRGKVTVLREAGITACARCAAIHSSEDRFCPNCGLSLSPHADLPIAGATSVAPPPAPQPQPLTGQPSPPLTGQPSPPTTGAGAPGPSTASEPAPEPSAAGRGPGRAADPPSSRRPLDPVASGRSAPSPDPRPRAGSQATSEPDEPTEILNPPSAGS